MMTRSPLTFVQPLGTSQSGMMALTAFQAFLGAVTIGLSLFRGNASVLSTHHHALLEEANHAAALLGQYHARSANAVATNNTICASLLGPRFSVEADNVSMDQSAIIACPQHDHYHRKVCAQYHANKARAVGKLTWIRSQQTTICRALGELSSKLDGVMSQQATTLARQVVSQNLQGARLEVDDVSIGTSPWNGSSFEQACKLASKDAAHSDMVGHAFPILMDLMVPGLPKALIVRAPEIYCAVKGSAPIRLPEVPSVDKNSREECRGIEAEARSAVVEPVNVDSHAIRTAADFPDTAKPYLRCNIARPSECMAGEHDSIFGRRSELICTWAESRTGRLACEFDQAACYNDVLPKQSRHFLSGLSLPSLSGGETRAPSVANWNHADDFRTKARASQPLDPFTVHVSDALKTIVSFGAVTPGNALRQSYSYASCSRWYFADGNGSPFQDVAPSLQPFVQGWSHALTSCQ